VLVAAAADVMKYRYAGGSEEEYRQKKKNTDALQRFHLKN